MPVISVHQTESAFLSGLVGDWLFNEGSGQVTYNQEGALHANPHLLAAQEISYNQYWSLVGFTVTDAFAANPIDGKTTASRAVCSGNSRISSACSLAAAEYTVSIYTKSNTGSSQDFRFGYFDGTSHLSPAQTATTSWQRFSWTFTAGSTITTATILNTDVANDPLDLLIYAPIWETGASASTYHPQEWDLQRGALWSADSQDPTWITEGARFASASSQLFYGTISSALSTGAISAYYAFKQTGDGTFPAYAPGISETFGSSKFSLSPRYGGYPGFLFSTGALLNAQACNVNDSTWYMIIGTYNGSTMSLYINDTLVATASVGALPAAVIQRIFIGFLGSAYSKGDAAYAALCSEGHGATQVLNNFSTIASQLAGRGITLAPLDKWIAYEGDSLTVIQGTGSNAQYPTLVTSAFSPHIQGWDFAGSGNHISAAVARMGQVNATFKPGRSKNILTVWFGANDLTTDSPATFVATLKSYCMGMKALNAWKIVVLTVLPRTSPAGFNAARNTTNALILADPDFTNGQAADRIANVASDPNIGQDGDSTDLTYFVSDGIHLNDTGQSVVAPYVSTAVGLV